MAKTGILAVGLAISAIAAGAQDRVTGPVTERGEIGGAEFLIEIPENWNGSLLMYAHGYVMASREAEFLPAIVKVGHRLGYAVAQSKYSRQGWAAREGVLDTEALRRYFVDKYGPTYPTIIAGHSQGAFISHYTIENFPEVYDGALPMCGTGQSALEFFKTQVFDTRVLFDHYFPGLAGGAVDFPDGEHTLARVALKVGGLMKEKPELAERFVRVVGIPTVEQAPGVIAFWSEILRELQLRTGGNAFDNRGTIYSGFDDDTALNRSIKRYAADAKAVEYLRQWVSTTGEIRDPVLALHTIVDQLIPASDTEHYARLTAVAGTSDLFAQFYTAGQGHCAFTEDEMAEALELLTLWIKDGMRPVQRDLTAKPAPAQ